MERLPFRKQEPLSEEEKWKIKSDGQHEQAWRQDEFLIGTRQVYIIGLMHDLKTFEMHQQEIEETIKKSSVVLLEGYLKREMPEIIPDRFPTQDDISAFRKELERLIDGGAKLPLDPKDISDDLIRRELVLFRQRIDTEKHEFYQFYDQVRQIAALYQKPIAFADPMHLVQDRAREKINRGAEHLVENHLLEASSAEQDIREGALYTGLVATALALFLSKFAPTTESLTRRTFLRLAAAGAASAVLGGASTLAEQVEAAAFGSGGHLDRIKNPLGAFRYNALTDYREISVGLAVQRLADNASGAPIAVFFGRSHINSIRHYATSPIEAQLRLLAYPQQLKYAQPTLTIYEFDIQRSQWVMKKKESLLQFPNSFPRKSTF